MRKATRANITDLVKKGTQPEKMRTTEGLGLRHGRRLIPLLKPSGHKTEAGLFYEQESGQTLPEGGFLQQKAMRVGNTETIK